MHRGAGDYRPAERRIMLRTIVYPNRGRGSGLILWRLPLPQRAADALATWVALVR